MGKNIVVLAVIPLMIVIGLCGCQDTSTNSTQTSQIALDKNNFVESNSQPTIAQSSPTNYESQCEITPTSLSPVEHLNFTVMNQWYGKNDGPIAYTVGLIEISEEYNGRIDTVLYTTKVLKLSDMNEEIEYRLYELMEEKIGPRSIISKCCRAFKSYKFAFEYLHFYEERRVVNEISELNFHP